MKVDRLLHIQDDAPIFSHNAKDAQWASQLLPGEVGLFFYDQESKEPRNIKNEPLDDWSRSYLMAIKGRRNARETGIGFSHQTGQIWAIYDRDGRYLEQGDTRVHYVSDPGTQALIRLAQVTLPGVLLVFFGSFLIVDKWTFPSSFQTWLLLFGGIMALGYGALACFEAFRAHFLVRAAHRMLSPPGSPGREEFYKALASQPKSFSPPTEITLVRTSIDWVEPEKRAIWTAELAQEGFE